MEQLVFSKLRLLHLLDQAQAENRDYITVYLTPDAVRWPASEMASQLGAMPEEVREALEDESILRAAERCGSGLALLWSAKGDGLVVLPPFAITEDKVSWGAVDTSLLRRLLEKECLIGIVLVNWGSYAVGVFDGNMLVASKIGTGHIHPRHKKGGRSQKRFARRTEEQKKDFLRRAANRIEETLQGYQLEHLFFGGNRLILKPLLDEAAYLRFYTSQISPRHLTARYANREALLGSLEHANESLCFRC